MTLTTTKRKSRVGEAALTYAQRLGWPVFPCCWITENGACSCGNSACSSPGKHPLTKHGLKDATTDPEQIRAWWTKWPEANIGTPTGAASGFDVLDVDLRHGGDSSLADLEAKYGKLPETVVQLSGGGGYHYLFPHRPGLRSRSGILPGIDVKADGGYILVAPSTHVSGRRYAWEPSSRPSKVEIAPWPEWALELVRKPARDEKATPPPEPREGQSTAYGRAALQGEAERVRHALPGQQETTLNEAAFNLGTLVGAGVLEYEETLATLMEAGGQMRSEEGRAPWSMEQVREKAEHGLVDGMQHPRAVPASNGKASSLLTASLRPPTDPQTDLPKGANLPAEQLLSPLGGGGQQQLNYHRQTSATLRAAYTATRWAVEALLPQPGILLLAGIPGIGKTWLVLLLAIAVAAGRAFLGRFQTRQGPVLLVLEEEDASAVLERLDLLYAGLGLSQEAGDTLPVHFLIQQGVSLVTPEGTIDPELLRHIQEVNPVLVCVDPFRRVHDLDENDSGQMSGLFNRLRGLARAEETACSLLLVHHLRKRSEHQEDTLDRLRGSSDIAASVDSVLEVGGQFGHLVMKHSKSKRGPALGTFLVLGEISAQAVSLKFTDPDIKAEIDREALRGWLAKALSQGGPQNLSQLSKAGKPLGYGRDRIRRTCEGLVKERIINTSTGPRNSTVYALPELLLTGGAGAENNNLGHREAGGEI